jgi:hypothetical protein
MKKILLAFIFASWAATLAGAQTAKPFYRPMGFCSLSSMASATALSSCSTMIPSGSSSALICAYTQGVVWRDDGAAPTSTPGSGGQGLAANQCQMFYNNLGSLQFIQQSSGAILGVSFYQ